jgi:DNA-cytosine methyltransferase
MKNNGNITTVLSLFDGISCARVALERLGYTDILYLASEVDKYAIQIAQKNFPDTIQLGDVRNIKREDLPQVIDLLIGGSPCQDLSIAKNNRKGLDGERSGLFWEWVRLWRECQPRYWVLENVNSMPKEAKRIISETLGVEPIMINAALVSAQNRKRLFWTNIATDIFGHCHIPLPEDRGILLRDILESGTAQDEINKSYCIDANYYKGGKKDTHNQSGKRLMVIDNIYPSGGQNGENSDKSYAIPCTYYKENIKSLDQRKKTGLIVKEEADKPIRVGDLDGKTSQGYRIYSTEGKSIALSRDGGGLGAKTGLYSIPEARGVALRSRTRHDNHADEKYEKLPEISGEKANAMTSVQTDSMVAVAIPEATKKAPSQMTSSQSVGVLEGYTIRKLTPIECERLQSLPDNYTEKGLDTIISFTQRYKCLGNAFNVEVVRHILSFMEL